MRLALSYRFCGKFSITIDNLFEDSYPVIATING